MSDEYELLPVVELEKLRQEVAALKQGHVSTAGPSIQQLQQSIETLTATMNRLLKVFTTIDDELIAKAQTLNTYEGELSELRSQNEHIAQGMVSIAQMLKEQQEQAIHTEQQRLVDREQEVPIQELETPTRSIEQQREQRSTADSTSQAVDQQEAPLQSSNPPQQDAPTPAETPVSPSTWNDSSVQHDQQDPWELPEQQPFNNQQSVYQQPYDSVEQQEPMVEPLPFNQEQPTPTIQNTPQVAPPENKKGLFGLFTK
jgi:hypothetical protein